MTSTPAFIEVAVQKRGFQPLSLTGPSPIPADQTQSLSDQPQSLNDQSLSFNDQSLSLNGESLSLNDESLSLNDEFRA